MSQYNGFKADAEKRKKDAEQLQTRIHGTLEVHRALQRWDELLRGKGCGGKTPMSMTGPRQKKTKIDRNVLAQVRH
jgi:hypothetical protein